MPIGKLRKSISFWPVTLSGNVAVPLPGLPIFRLRRLRRVCQGKEFWNGPKIVLAGVVNEFWKGPFRIFEWYKINFGVILNEFWNFPN